jgi:hypothetical protein
MRNSIFIVIAVLMFIVGCTSSENPRVVFAQVSGIDIPENAEILEFSDTHGGKGQFELMAGAGASDGVLVISIQTDTEGIAFALSKAPWGAVINNSAIDSARFVHAFDEKERSSTIPKSPVPHYFRERQTNNGVCSNGDLLIVDEINKRIMLISWDT